MLEDSLTDAVNSLAKQLRTFDASIRREDKAIESMKIDLAAARALKSKSARDVDSLAEEVALLRLRKVEEVESKLQETISKRQIANQRSQEAKDDMKREKSDLRAQYDAFLADNEDYLKELDASRLGKTLEDAKKMKAKFLARFPGLEQREEAAISQVDKITERKHKRYKQLQNVEDYISWLTQGKENLNKEQAEVEAQLAARRKEHRESPEESIIAADILTLHHQKQTMQDKVDVLIMKEMQEQQEIAKLRKALDHSALAAARRDQRSKKGSRAPKSTFVTARRVLSRELETKSRGQGARKPTKSPRPASSIQTKDKGRTPKRQKNSGGPTGRKASAGAAAPASPTTVDPFGGKKFFYA